jgi:hypothetical protein
MNDEYYQNRLCDVIERLAVNLRVELETFKAEQHTLDKEVSIRIAVLESTISSFEKLLKEKKKTEASDHKEHTNIIKGMLQIILAIVGVLTLGLTLLKDFLFK